jgi:4-aminobutyrate aminotransferase-like enzyme
MGVEMVSDLQTRESDAAAFKDVQCHVFERELIIIDCGPDGNILRFIPPLVATRDELDWAIDLIDEGLTSWETG